MEPDATLTTIEDYCEFGEHRVYLLMAIARTREKPHLASNSEVVFREFLKDEDDIDYKLQKLACVTENYRDDDGDPLTFRLYLSVNARNTLKAYFNFLDRLNGWAKDIVYGDEAVARNSGNCLIRSHPTGPAHHRNGQWFASLPLIQLPSQQLHFYRHQQDC